jgi:hypothetical protein
MKKISSGIIIQNEFDEFLLGHSTGNSFYDIFKGGTEPDETPIMTALRECQDIIDLGQFIYNKEKNLHLFIYKVSKESIDVNKLACSTFVVNEKYSYPEMDKFDWFNAEQLLRHTATSMNKVFKSLITQNILTLKTIPNDLDNIPSTHEAAKINKKKF